MNRSLTRVMRSVIAVVSLVASLGAAAAPSSPASGVVDGLNQQLLATMQHAKALGFQGRYKKLAPVIDRSFDLERIARLALGPQWDALDLNQQKKYQAMFRRDTLATYAERFNGYDGEKFEITNTQAAPGGREEVDTVIADKDGERVPINYVLENDAGRWQIINVVAKGVSDLALKRGQYTTVIKNKGAEGFIEQFQAQLKKYPSLPEES